MCLSLFSHCQGDAIEQEFCPRSVCSIYSVWSQWGDWSQCSKECGEGGIRTRTRECPGEKNHPSVTCGENRLESEACNTHLCTNHEWGEWGEWSNCPNLMTNKQVRKRECIGEGPKHCPGLFRYQFLFFLLLLLYFSVVKTISISSLSKKNCRNSSIVDCIFDYILIECRFNKNSLLQIYFSVFLPGSQRAEITPASRECFSQKYFL